LVKMAALTPSGGQSFVLPMFQPLRGPGCHAVGSPPLIRRPPASRGGPSRPFAQPIHCIKAAIANAPVVPIGGGYGGRLRPVIRKFLSCIIL